MRLWNAFKYCVLRPQDWSRLKPCTEARLPRQGCDVFKFDIHFTEIGAKPVAAKKVQEAVIQFLVVGTAPAAKVARMSGFGSPVTEI